GRAAGRGIRARGEPPADPHRIAEPDRGGRREPREARPELPRPGLKGVYAASSGGSAVPVIGSRHPYASRTNGSQRSCAPSDVYAGALFGGPRSGFPSGVSPAARKQAIAAASAASIAQPRRSRPGPSTGVTAPARRESRTARSFRRFRLGWRNAGTRQRATPAPPVGSRGKSQNGR